jgi:ribonuclease-3
VLPRCNQGADPRLQQNYGNTQQNGNDPKRRKLNNIINNKKSPKKQVLQVQQASKPPTTQQRKNQKPPVKALIANDPLISNLISEALSQPTGPYLPNSNSIPKFPEITKPKNYPPPLPPIHDKVLEQQCFTHPSYTHDPLNKDTTSASMHYERLEFLGDSYMNYCVTKILYSRLPGLREGELTRFRSQIISNDNIRHYAVMYGFQERLLLSSGAEKDEIRDAGKKIADIFEAYIGGVLTDQPDDGERVISQWMADVIAPQVEAATKIAGNILNINKNAKQDLYVLIDAEKLPAPIYVVTREGSTNTDFEVACLVHGKEMGRGCGKNKNEAGTRAAMQVLDNLRARTARLKADNEARLQGMGNGREKKKRSTEVDTAGSTEKDVEAKMEESSDEVLSEGEISVDSDD